MATLILYVLAGIGVFALIPFALLAWDVLAEVPPISWIESRLIVPMMQRRADRHRHKASYRYLCEECGLFHEAGVFHLIYRDDAYRTACPDCWRRLHGR